MDRVRRPDALEERDVVATLWRLPRVGPWMARRILVGTLRGVELAAIFLRDTTHWPVLVSK